MYQFFWPKLTENGLVGFLIHSSTHSLLFSLEGKELGVGVEVENSVFNS